MYRSALHSCKSLVPLEVESEVVRSSKRALAVLTLEWLHPRVFAHVTGEFVGASKLPTAPLPVALVGFLPRVGPLVRLEV